LVIGASRDAANELARKVVQARSAAFGWHRLTLPQLAALLAASEPRERRALPIGHVGVQAICARVVHRLAARGELGRYSSIEGPGFGRALARVVMELRLAKLGPDDLRIVAPDLLPLVEAYASQLAEDEVTDWAGVLTLATDAMVNEGFTHRLLNLRTLLLDVSVASEAELAFVRALSSRVPELVLTSPARDEATIARLRDGLGPRVEDLDQVPHPDASSVIDSAGSLSRLQHHLFNEDTAPSASPPDDQVSVFSAPGEGRECVEIARRVLALGRDGVAFDRMAVLLRSPEEYRGPLEEAFARAGVPAHFARGAVRPDPAGRAFCVLLRCAVERLSARRFAEYLSLGQVPDATPEGTPPDAAPRSERWITPDEEFIARPSWEDLTEQSTATQEITLPKPTMVLSPPGSSVPRAAGSVSSSRRQ
jgi:ATP-dependent helicase/nuclease subunit B